MNDTREGAAQAAATIQKQIDEGSSKAGDLAGVAATAVRDRTSMADDAVEAVASKLDSASDYLHDANTDTLRHDVTSYIKRHPVQSVAAVVGGLVLLRMLTH